MIHITETSELQSKHIQVAESQLSAFGGKSHWDVDATSDRTLPIIWKVCIPFVLILAHAMHPTSLSKNPFFSAESTFLFQFSLPWKVALLVF